MQRIALEDALCGKPKTSQAMLLDGFYGVVRAGGVEPTPIGQQGRQHPLIHTNREDEKLAKHAGILASNAPLDN